MRVLDRLADRDEELEALAGGELIGVAVLRDGDAVDELHHEVGPAGFGRPGVEDPGDVRVVHHGEGLALGLEPGDDLIAVHAGLDDLERDLATDGLLLLGHVDDAHAALADLLEQLVGTDPRARPFGQAVVSEGHRDRVDRPTQEAAGLLVRPEQVLDPLSQRGVADAGAFHEGRPLGRARPFQGEGEDRLLRQFVLRHGWDSLEKWVS